MVARSVRCRAGASRGRPLQRETAGRLEFVQQRSQGDRANSGRGQLDRERQAIESPKDFGDGSPHIIRQSEVRVRRAGTLDEELHSL